MEPWQAREQARLISGEYKPIPSEAVGGLEIEPEHFLHLSTTDGAPEMVAFTASAPHGERDRQTRMKFGRYLKRYFPALSDCETQRRVVALRAAVAYVETADEYVLRFASDRETIDRIFETAMCPCDSTTVSCMHGKFTSWEHRPYHVYADSPDVAVAYLMQYGNIVARSVVSTKDSRYVRLYAVGGAEAYCSMLRTLLGEQGYHFGELTGSRLNRLPLRHGDEVLPYLDNGGMSVSLRGGYWVVESEGGDYVGDRTDGTASTADLLQCERCDRDEDDCQCSFCECCEENYYPYCEACTICEHCENCRTHDICDCEYCPECDQVVDARFSACRCSRCGECGKLADDCECERCGECENLVEDCTCEPEEEVEEEEVSG